MEPDEVVDIIREDQSQLDRTIADINEQKSRKSSSAEQPRDQKISHWGKTPKANGKHGG
jgi:hypothetical protein